MFDNLTTRPRLGVFRSLPEKKKGVQKSVWVGSESESNRLSGCCILDADELFGVVLPNSEYGTTTTRRSVSTFSADQGVGSVPYSTNRLSHGPLRQTAKRKKCRQKGRLESTSSMACRLSGHGRVPIPAECHSEKSITCTWKSWLACLLAFLLLAHPGLPLAALPLPICKSQSSNPA